MSSHRESIFKRNNVLARIYIVIFLIGLWLYQYVVRDPTSIDPETLAKYELGLYGTPIIVMYCFFEIWRTFNCPYKLIINYKKKTLTEIYLMSQKTLAYESIEKAQVRAGLVFLVVLSDNRKIRVKGEYKEIPEAHKSNANNTNA
ncbi:MAG: hypothetical protein VYD53_16070 [Pseudomonadota bacterium]|nr:hypothetical protein [Pseudomonadota bacterium]